jgi:hypothetical protein
MLMASIAFVGNTNDLLLTGLKSEIENTFLADAVITVTVKDINGVPVVGETWPKPMTYIPGSDGSYVAGLSHLMHFSDSAKYTAFIDADATDTGAERIGHWEFPFTAKTRIK